MSRLSDPYPSLYCFDPQMEALEAELLWPHSHGRLLCQILGGPDLYWGPGHPAVVADDLADHHQHDQGC